MLSKLRYAIHFVILPSTLTEGYLAGLGLELAYSFKARRSETVKPSCRKVGSSNSLSLGPGTSKAGTVQQLLSEGGSQR